MNRTLRRTTLLFFATVLAACGNVDGPDNGYADDPSIFGAAAKADGLSLEEGGAEARAVLRVANELSFADLDDVVKLDVRAAQNIIDTRAANGDFLTLRELDAVKYVGVTAITRMRGYAEDAGWIDASDPAEPGAEAVYGVVPGSYEALGILAVANDASLEALDVEAALDARAARNIVAARPITSLEGLDGVSYVGAKAFGQLLDFAHLNDLVPSCGDGTLQAALEACDDGNLASGDGCSALCAIDDDGGVDLNTVHGVLEGSDDALHILRVANEASLEVLDDDVGLDARAARNIVEARANGPIPNLTALDAVGYVGAAAFGKLLGFDLGEPVDPIEPDDALIYDGAAQCSGESHGATRYTYTVISNPPAANTDARIELRFNSGSPYSPRSQDLELETAPNVWTTVFTTMPASSGWQAQTAFVAAETINAAMGAMGWLRFRVNPGTYYSACSELSVTYNCPECFACPAGQEDVGFGCQDIGAPFSQTLLDHSTGMCGRSSSDLTFISAPVAASAGTLSLQYLPCDGGTITVSINTANAGWVGVGTDSTGLSCGFKTANFNVPEAYLDAARNAAGEIEVRYSISDSCRPGMGCAGYSDPCVRRVNLQFEQ